MENAQSQISETSPRKVFNCIVDDTALVAGVKRSTRDGIRKWVKDGSIRLFVPLQSLSRLRNLSPRVIADHLQALGQLDRVKEANTRFSADVRETLQWLDEATDNGQVCLQGMDQLYPNWEEAEKFLLPDTLLSQGEENEDADGLAEELGNKMHVRSSSDQVSISSKASSDAPQTTPSSPRSVYSSTSPGLLNATPYKQRHSADMSDSTPSLNGAETARNSMDKERTSAQSPDAAAVPKYMRPLFNHVLWRINHESNAKLGLDSFILLTHDPKKQSIAQRFGIRAKRLEQLRDAVQREDREYKARLALLKKEAEAARKPAVPEEDDEDEVILKRPVRSSTSPATAAVKPPPPVIDANNFVRGPPKPFINNRGGRSARFAPRGGRGNFIPTGPRNHTPVPINPNQPIDPNSFSRPSPLRGAMRGGRKKLWEPM